MEVHWKAGPLWARVSSAIALVAIVFSCREHTDTDTLPPGERRGEALFAKHCAACHGIDGRGQPLPAPGEQAVLSRNLATRAFQADHSDEQIRSAITQGVPPGMPAFGQVLSPSETQDVVGHVRQLVSP